VEAPRADRFSGRSSVVSSPPTDFGAAFDRSSLAFYRPPSRRPAPHCGGRPGRASGWDLKNRLSLTFAGSVGSQLNGLAAVPGSADRFCAAGQCPWPRPARIRWRRTARVETDRSTSACPPSGQSPLATLRGVALDAIQVEVKTSLAADETEGWTIGPAGSAGRSALRREFARVI